MRSRSDLDPTPTPGQNKTPTPTPDVYKSSHFRMCMRETVRDKVVFVCFAVCLFVLVFLKQLSLGYRIYMQMNIWYSNEMKKKQK